MKLNHCVVVACLSGFSAFASANWSTGILGVGQSNPYIAGEAANNIFPIVAYEGEKLVWRGPFLDYYAIGTSRSDFSLSLNVGLVANELDTDNDSTLEGIQDRDNSFMAGVTFRQAVLRGTLNATLQTDISGEHDGQRALLGWSTPIASHERKKWQLNAGVEVEYLSDKFANHYYGISLQEATVSDFAFYQADAIVQPAITVGGYYSFNQRWRLIGNLRATALASDITDSPIIDSDYLMSAVVGVTYLF